MTAADIVDLDDYRRDESGVFLPSHLTATTEPIEPVDVEHDQAAVELADDEPNPQRTESGDDGVTWRVRMARRGSAVQQRLSETPAKPVIKAGSRNQRAAQLEELAGDPRAEAYANRKARFWLLLMAAIGIALGVGISASSAQQTITSYMSWAVDSVAGIAAYGADPALGLVLFATLGARILASARGVAVPEVARKALNLVEGVLFGLVALLNAGPSLGRLIGDVFGRQWGQLGPDFMVLVIHCLGPVLVASGVFGIPYMALILSEITAATNAKRAGSSTASHLHRKKAEEELPEPRKKSVSDLRDALEGAVERGEIDPERDSVNAVAKHIGTRWNTAKELLRKHSAA